MDKAFDAAANYGLLGLVLLAVGVFFWAAWRWTSENVIRKMVESYIKQQEAFIEIQKRTAETQNLLNERMAVFMNVMAQHASAEERQMLAVVDTQRQLAGSHAQMAEMHQRLVLQKDTIELLASEVREVKTTQQQGTPLPPHQPR